MLLKAAVLSFESAAVGVGEYTLLVAVGGLLASNIVHMVSKDDIDAHTHMDVKRRCRMVSRKLA